MSVLETLPDQRPVRETSLREDGFVPLTSYDAPYPRFNRTLPACRIRQVVPDLEHGRVVWSHPGRSWLGPRAIAPLAFVRVADGLGPDPLDSPVDVATAARELLDVDVSAWLLRDRYRVLVRGGPVLAYDALRRDGGPVPPEAGWSTPRHGLPAGRSAAALRRASAHREPSARAAQGRPGRRLAAAPDDDRAWQPAVTSAVTTPSAATLAGSPMARDAISRPSLQPL